MKILTYILILISIIGVTIIFRKRKPKNENKTEPERDISKILKLGKIAGFLGHMNYSPNLNYSVYFSDGHINRELWQNGNIALFENEKLLFTKKIERPNDCKVSNKGTIICCDWLNSKQLNGVFLIFDRNGKEIFSIKTTANLGSSSISDNSEYAIFETHNSDSEDGNKIFIVNLITKEIYNFKRPISFISAIINSEKRTIQLFDRKGYEMEIDFNGIEINNKYKFQIMEKGTLNELLLYFHKQSDEIKYNDPDYINALTRALNKDEETYSFGFDKIYRKIGEYYENKNEIEKTIYFWNKAIQINPKVGIKSKLEKYKK